MKAVLPVSAPRLWSLVCWNGRLLDWYPAAVTLTTEAPVKGARRCLGLSDGARLVQRLDHLSRIEDAYTYSMVAGPYPVADYLAQIRVLPHADGHTTMVWTANFQPFGADEAAAEDFIRRLYQAGFDALYAHLCDAAGVAQSNA